MTTSKENRRSFRITETLFIDYTKIDEIDLSLGLEHWKLIHGKSANVRAKLLDLDTRLKQKLYLLKSESAHLSECLAMLDEKITTVANEIPGLKESKKSLANRTPQTCEVSADGIFFSADESFQAGQILVLALLFAADNHFIETFARVVRMVDTPPDDSGQYRYGIATEFVDLDPDEKDGLIQHLFDRESETLRMRRLEVDAADLKRVSGD